MKYGLKCHSYRVEYLLYITRIGKYERTLNHILHSHRIEYRIFFTHTVWKFKISHTFTVLKPRLEFDNQSFYIYISLPLLPFVFIKYERLYITWKNLEKYYIITKLLYFVPQEKLPRAACVCYAPLLYKCTLSVDW